MYNGGPSTPTQSSGPLRPYLSSPHTPYLNPHHHQLYRSPGMDSFGAPSPSSSFLESSPASTSYIHHTNASSSSLAPTSNRPPYLSPHLSQQFDSLATSSTAHLPAPLPPTQPPQQVEQQHVVVLDWSPLEGGQGTTLSIKCEVNLPPTPPSYGGGDGQSGAGSHGKALRVVFGSQPVQTTVHILSSAGHMGGGQICQLTATAPSWVATGGAPTSRGNRVSVYIQVLADNHNVMETVLMGEFVYSAGPSRVPFTSYPSSGSLKRAGESLESHRPSPNQFLHRRVFSNSNMSRMDSPVIEQYSQLGATYHPAPPTGEHSPVYTSPYMGASATLPALPPPPGPGPAYSPSPGAQPSLMRSTQVSVAAPAPTTYVPVSGGKASLELSNDLGAMSKGWSQEEWVSKRRLVQFWRRQEGTTIFATCRPLSQHEYPQQQNSIIISCIFREEKNTCYVTSVDAIYLLEALVGNRFTVEEKNRIRRNLEGFRPLTVSKSRPESEEFFKLIMGFPNPKPRNIEKDVKVFPWDILGQALKKIISKYSASYPYQNPLTSGPAPHQTSPMSYNQPLPIPLPSLPESYGSAGSNDSVPALVSHSSSDSNNSSMLPSSTSYGAHPETPQIHSNSLPHSQSTSSSPGRYAAGGSSGNGGGGGGGMIGGNEKATEVGYAPSSYAPTSGHQAYWPTQDGSLPSPGSYGVMSGPMGYGDSPHQLPHVHQTLSRQPSSNDLRVMYPTLST